jgi:hypothetical protein
MIASVTGVRDDPTPEVDCEVEVGLGLSSDNEDCAFISLKPYGSEDVTATISIDDALYLIGALRLAIDVYGLKRGNDGRVQVD